MRIVQCGKEKSPFWSKINNSKVIRNVFVNESTKANSNSQFNSNSNSIKQVRKHTSDMELQIDSKLK